MDLAFMPAYSYVVSRRLVCFLAATSPVLDADVKMVSTDTSLVV